MDSYLNTFIRKFIIPLGCIKEATTIKYKTRRKYAKKINDPQNPSSIENEVENNKYGISSSKLSDTKLIPPVDNDAPIIVLCIRFCGAHVVHEDLMYQAVDDGLFGHTIARLTCHNTAGSIGLV